MFVDHPLNIGVVLLNTLLDFEIWDLKKLCVYCFYVCACVSLCTPCVHGSHGASAEPGPLQEQQLL